MTYEKKQEISERIDDYLRKNGMYADVRPYWDDLPVVDVEIHWGDWKHEHLRTKWLMEEIGVQLIQTIVTEENGSDCYSAIHQFYVTEDVLEEVA